MLWKGISSRLRHNVRSKYPPCGCIQNGVGSRYVASEFVPLLNPITLFYRWASPIPSLPGHHIRHYYNYIDRFTYIHSFHRSLQATKGASNALLDQLDYFLDPIFRHLSVHCGKLSWCRATFRIMCGPGSTDLFCYRSVRLFLVHCCRSKITDRLPAANAAYTLHVRVSRFW